MLGSVGSHLSETDVSVLERASMRFASFFDEDDDDDDVGGTEGRAPSSNCENCRELEDCFVWVVASALNDFLSLGADL